MGETKSKGNDAVYLNLKVDDKKFVIGNLSSDKNPQMQFDLVFEKDFELSHNWKHGSIYFCGYQTAYGEQYPCFTCFLCCVVILLLCTVSIFFC